MGNLQVNKQSQVNEGGLFAVNDGAVAIGIEARKGRDPRRMPRGSVHESPALPLFGAGIAPHGEIDEASNFYGAGLSRKTTLFWGINAARSATK